MPKITDFKKNEKSPFFKKKTYTPWDNSPGIENSSKNDGNSISNLEIGLNEVQNRFEIGSKKVQKAFNKGSEIGSKKVPEKFEIGSETGSKEVLNRSKTGSEIGLKQVQKGSSGESDIDVAEEVYNLSGSQKRILNTIVDICSLKGALKTPPINLTELSLTLGIPRETTKTAVRRLLSKNIIQKISSRKGIGGFMCFGVSENVKFYALENKKNERHAQLILDPNRFKMVSEIGSEIGSEAPIVSSSNSFINNTITTTSEFGLPEDWLFDWQILAPIGFRESHLKKIYQATLPSSKGPGKNLDPSKIRESIFALSHDLKDPERKQALESKYSKIGLVNVFVGTMMRGETWVPTRDPGSFKLPEERYLEEKEAEFKRRNEIIEKTKELQYREWLDALPEAELLSLAPSDHALSAPERVRKTLIRNKALEVSKDYFDAEVWPGLKKKVQEEIEAF